MADIEIIPTYTTILATVPPVDIITYYLDPNIGDVWSTFINDTYQWIDGQNILEGYSMLFANNSVVQALLSIYIDNDGHLIFSGLNASKYSIDTNGHLIYTT